jgi:hypothetical protein
MPITRSDYSARSSRPAAARSLRAVSSAAAKGDRANAAIHGHEPNAVSRNSVSGSGRLLLLVIGPDFIEFRTAIFDDGTCAVLRAAPSKPHLLEVIASFHDAARARDYIRSESNSSDQHPAKRPVKKQAAAAKPKRASRSGQSLHQGPKCCDRERSPVRSPTASQSPSIIRAATWASREGSRQGGGDPASERCD